MLQFETCRSSWMAVQLTISLSPSLHSYLQRQKSKFAVPETFLSSFVRKVAPPRHMDVFAGKEQ